MEPGHRLGTLGVAHRSIRSEQSVGVGEPRVYVSRCDAWLPRAVAQRMLPLILESVATGTRTRAAAEAIDARLREDFGSDWTGDQALLRRGIRSVRVSHLTDRAVRRLGPALTRPVPASLRPALATIYQPLARYLAAAGCRQRYGRRFVSMIHAEDDLLHYGLDAASAERAFRYYRAAQAYFTGGEWNAGEVEEVLADVGVSLRDVSSFLEFACGYGRLTRHFVHRINPSKVTVSDIDRRAVDFVTKTFGVRGFYSSPRAEELTHDGAYDVIVVVSLFSHLPVQHWSPWLKSLNEMLNSRGFLVLSVLGRHAWDVNVSDADRKAFRVKADGFLYGEENETRGRLSTDDYGVAYVSEQFVQGAVSESFAGGFVKACPRALNGFQDVYVLQAD